MNVIEPVVKIDLVRADSYAASRGFRYIDEQNDYYGYFVPMSPNSAYLYIRQSVREGQSIFIEPEYILVFNITHNSAGLVKADRMVEPVDFTVQAEEKN